MPKAEDDHHNGVTAAGCQVDSVLKFLAREWMSHIVWALSRQPAIRFGALRRALPGGISARVLSARLKELETHGFVARIDKGKLPLHVEYSLTGAGRQLDGELRRSESLTARLKIRSSGTSARGVGRVSHQSHKPKVQSARIVRPD